MINTELYIDYVEGNLNEESEEVFAKKFADDSEFRAGFKSFITISNSISKNSKNFGVSQNEKNEIFSILKTTYPPVPVTIPMTQSIFQSSIFKYFLVGIASSIFTLVGGYLLWKQNDRVIQEKQKNNLFSETKQLPQNNQPVNHKADDVKNQKPIIKYIYLDKKDKQNSDKSKLINESNNDLFYQNNNKINKIEMSNINSSLQTYRINTNNFASQQLLNNFYQPENVIESNIRGIKNSRFRIELNNSPSWFYSSPKIQPSTNNQFNNFSFSIAYDINEDFLIGVNLKFETFYVVYDETNGANNYTIYQQPNLTTIGLNLKYSPIILFELIKPYAKIEAGGNYSGLVAREGVGFEYFLAPNAYLTFGFDLNQFLYKHQGNFFNDGKYSLNYGIGVKL